MGMRLRVFTSDGAGACVNTFAAHVVQCVERARLETANDATVRVGVTIRGDGRALAKKLREGLPNLAIDTVSSSSMSARLDATVRVWVGRNERFVLGLCNVAKVTLVALPWTLKEYSEWVTAHLGDADLSDLGMDTVEPALLALLVYYQDTSDWAVKHDVDELRIIVTETERLGQALLMVKSRTIYTLASKLLERAVDAGIDAAEVAVERARRALVALGV